jgi:hypothetical protein
MALRKIKYDSVDEKAGNSAPATIAQLGNATGLSVNIESPARKLHAQLDARIGEWILPDVAEFESKFTPIMSATIIAGFSMVLWGAIILAISRIF